MLLILIVSLLAASAHAELPTISVGDSVRFSASGEGVIHGVVDVAAEDAISVDTGTSKSMVRLDGNTSLEVLASDGWLTVRGLPIPAHVSDGAVKPDAADPLMRHVAAGDCVRATIRGRADRVVGTVVDLNGWSVLVEDSEAEFAEDANLWEMSRRQLTAVEVRRESRWVSVAEEQFAPFGDPETITIPVVSGPQRELTFWEEAWYNDASGTLGDYQSYLQRRITYDWTNPLRQGLVAQCHEYVGALHANGAVVSDPFIDDYLKARLLAVFPRSLEGVAPTEIDVLLVEREDLNAHALASGHILFTTGLLASLGSRAEIEAILAHEVAHIVEDHHWDSFRRAHRNETIATVLGSVVGAVVQYKSAEGGWSPEGAYLRGYYSGVLTQLLADDVLDRIGARRSRSQEARADSIAQEWLRATTGDTLALARALEHLNDPRVSMGRFTKESHPLTTLRLRKLPSAGPPQPDPYHLQVVMDLRIESARGLIAQGQYLAAGLLLNELTEQEITSADLSLLRAIVLRKTGDTTVLNEEALALALDAQSGDLPPPWSFGEAGLLQMRLGLLSDAEASFRSLVEEAYDGQTRDWARVMVGRIQRRLGSATGG